MQVQIPSEHRALEPQGDGLQGSMFTGSGAVLKCYKLHKLLCKICEVIILTWWWFWKAIRKRISSITVQASTNRNVI